MGTDGVAKSSEEVEIAGPPQRWTINFSSGLEAFNSRESLTSGHLQIFDYPELRLDWRNIDWEGLRGGSGDAQGAVSPSEELFLHSLKWVDPLIDDALSASTTAQASRELALMIATSWNLADESHVNWKEDEAIWGGHGAAMRTTTLVALSELDPKSPWLIRALNRHMRFLVEQFDGFWNHGLAESLALFAAATRIGSPPDAELAVERIRGCVGAMVDEEGCINEQAPEYARYVERLLRTVARIFEENHVEEIATIREKVRLIRNFIAVSLRPDGRFEELGDSFPRRPSIPAGTSIDFVMSCGARGSAPESRIALYQGGFVFGHSGFGTDRHPSDESFFSLRFGPGRRIHGHNDHTSLTYWMKNRSIIVDAGHVGYKDGPERAYVRSVEAHNVLSVREKKHRWDADTRMSSFEVGDYWQAFHLMDQPYDAVERDRSVCFADCGPFVVWDRASSAEPVTFRQLWHIAQEFAMEESVFEYVRLRSTVDQLDLYLIRYAISGQDFYGNTGLSVLRGDPEMRGGWRAVGDGELAPITTLSFDVRGKEVSLVTAVLPVERGMKAGWSFRKNGDEERVFRLQAGRRKWAFSLGVADGTVRGKNIPRPSSFG